MPDVGLPWHEFAVDKFGGEDRMRATFAQVSAAGQQDGVRFDFGKVANAPNTIEAHRLILHAAEYKRQWPLSGTLFEAYFSRGANLSNHEELSQIALSAGLDADKVRSFLKSSETVDRVWAVQNEAARLGVTGIPFYVFAKALDPARSEYAV